MCSARLCHDCGGYGMFLEGERVTLRLLVEFELDWASDSLRPLCCLLRREVKNAPYRLCLEWTLRLEGCSCWLSECGPNRECIFVRGPNWECTFLHVLRREYTLSRWPSRECTPLERSVRDWSSGCFGTPCQGYVASRCAARTDSSRSSVMQGCLSILWLVETSVVRHLDWKSLEGICLLKQWKCGRLQTRDLNWEMSNLHKSVVKMLPARW